MGPRHRTRETRRQWSLRIRALLVGGVVLGVGTTATLAVWTDTENTTGTFTASVFDIQSQTAGSPTYADHGTAPGATLEFTATTVSPGTSSYAWLNIRTTPASTVGGSVMLTASAASGGLSPVLQYRAVRMTEPSPSGACSAGAFAAGGTYLAGSATTYLPASDLPATATPSAIAAAGAQLGFCFDVRLAPDAASSYQGQAGAITWTFTATSAS